jgi:mRNA-degrading endonuclease YafQ of YafQ-DinJ toxin-antitoxin module
MSSRTLLGWCLSLGLILPTGPVSAQFGPGPKTTPPGSNVPQRPGAPAGTAIEISDEPKTIDPATLVPKEFSVPVTVSFQETSLKDVVAWLQNEQKLSTVLDTHALSDEGLLISEPITDRLQEAPLYLLLDRLRSVGLGWYVDDGLLQLTTLSAADEQMSTLSYNLGDLFDAGFESFDLLESVTQATSGRWEDVDGTGGEMVLLGDVLFVRHTHTVHREVMGLFAAIRKHGRRTLTNDPPQHAALREILLKPISVDFQSVPLVTALGELGQLSGADLRIDREGLKDVGVRERTPVSLKMTDQKLVTVLRVLLSEHQLDWVLRDGVLQITSADVADESLKAAVYDVRDLCQDQAESLALQAAIQSQTRAHWRDSDGTGGTLRFARPGVMIVFQSERTHDEVLQLLENYRTALRASKPRAKRGIDPEEVVTRYYRLPAVMVRDLVDVLPQLILRESWQSAEHPDAPGRVRSVASQPGPVPVPPATTGAPVVTEHAILIVTQTRAIQKEVGQLLDKLRTGDPLLDADHSGPGLGGGGLGAGGFGGGGFGGGFPMVK